MSLVRVELLPGSLAPDPRGVCAVVDVIRATTTLIAMAEAGNPEVWIAGDVTAAREAAKRLGPGTCSAANAAACPPRASTTATPRASSRKPT